MKYKNKPEDNAENKGSQEFRDIIDKLKDWNEDNLEQSVKTKTMLKEEMESLVQQYKEGNSITKKIVANRLKDINSHLKEVTTNMQGDKKLFTSSVEQILKEMNKSQSKTAKFNKGLIDTLSGDAKSEFGKAFMDNLNPIMRLSVESFTKASKFLFGKDKDQDKYDAKLDSILGRFEKNMDASQKKDKTREMKETLSDMNKWSKKYYHKSGEMTQKIIDSQNQMVRILEGLKSDLKPNTNEETKSSDAGTTNSPNDLLVELQVISHYEYANQILLDKISDSSHLNTEYLNEQLTTLDRIESDLGGLLIKLENPESPHTSTNESITKPDTGLTSDGVSGQLSQISEYISYIGEILLKEFDKKDSRGGNNSGGNSNDLISLYGDIQGEDFNKVHSTLDTISKSITENTEYSNEIWDTLKESNNKLERLIDLSNGFYSDQRQVFATMNGNLVALNDKTDIANEDRKNADMARQKEALGAIERHNELMAQTAKNNTAPSIATSVGKDDEGKGSGTLKSLMDAGRGLVAKKVAQSVLGRILPQITKILPSLSAMLPSMSTLGSAALGAAPLGLMAYATNEAGDTSKDNSRSNSLLDMTSNLKDKLKDWFGFDKDSEIDAIRKKNRAELGGDDTTFIPSKGVQVAEITTAQKENQVLNDQLKNKPVTLSGNAPQVTNVNTIDNGVTNVFNNGLSTRNRDTSWSARLLNNGLAS